MDGLRWCGRCAALALLAACCLPRGGSAGRQFLNEWAAEVPAGPDAARDIAEELGYDLVGQVRAEERARGAQPMRTHPFACTRAPLPHTYPCTPLPPTHTRTPLSHAHPLIPYTPLFPLIPYAPLYLLTPYAPLYPIYTHLHPFTPYAPPYPFNPIHTPPLPHFRELPRRRPPPHALSGAAGGSPRPSPARGAPGAGLLVPTPPPPSLVFLYFFFGMP